MNLNEFCRRLDEEFHVESVIETWPLLAQGDPALQKFAAPQFRTNGNGLLVQGEPQVDEVYTAVYPTRAVVEHVVGRALPGSVLICHIPMRLDGRAGYLPPDPSNLADLKDGGISLYILHAPLVWAPHLSTWRSLARALGIDIEGEIMADGKPVGCYGKVEVEPHLVPIFDFSAFLLRLEERLDITNSQVAENLERVVGRVAVVPGDGGSPELLEQADAFGCQTYVTGILDNPLPDPAIHDRSAAFLSLAATRAINLVGASQYATQAPGVRLLATWAQALGLSGAFVPDVPELAEFLRT
ncbi:MAG: Nif3-like dinuclear metal center hexameric protein [Anaerolineae bacterium]